jgi:enterochelin esterase-like enzyme
VSARRALAVAVFLALVAAGVYLIVRPDHGADSRSDAGTTTANVVVERFTIESKLVRRSLEQIVVAPKGGGEGRPLLVLLHGYGSEPASFLRPAWLDALAKLGDRAPDLLLANGGVDSFYHNRADGRWADYVLDEAIPAAVRKLGADGSRVAIGGISMGGFGALDLAVHNVGVFCAVGGHSPAVWRTVDETPPGAFDDREDFERNDLIEIAYRSAQPFRRTQVWIDMGLEDSFVSAVALLADALLIGGQSVVLHAWPGSHNTFYWDHHARQYLRFYAEALERC